jgi:hypothetical protein
LTQPKSPTAAESSPVVRSLEQLIAHYEAEGYDWDPENLRFLARPGGPVARSPNLSMRVALERVDAER